MMPCPENADLLAAYAAGTLPPGDRGRLERHLPTCPGCRAELADHEQALDALSTGLAAASPHRLDPALKARVMSAVPPAVRPGRPRVRAWQLVATAATILLVISLAWNLLLVRQVSDDQRLVAKASQLGPQQQTVFDVLDCQGGTKRPLRSTGTSGPYGKLWTCPRSADVVVMINRLPAPSRGQSYHLQVTSGGQTQDAGVIAVDREGFGYLVFKAPQPGPSYQSAAVRLQNDSDGSGQTVLYWEGST